MSDLICRKTQMRCQTPGMCAPYGGCTPQPVAESVLKADYAALIEQAKSAPAEPDAELVELLRSKFPRIDPCKPVPLDEKAHCCEYAIYVERERLHRIIDAKLASLKGAP